MNWNETYNNNDCVKKSINCKNWRSAEYRKKEKDEEKSIYMIYVYIGVGFGAAAIVIAAILIILIKKFNYNQDDANKVPLKESTFDSLHNSEN